MGNGKVLIVEDDEDLAYMLEYNLSKRGYHSITALNGRVACSLIEKERPDLILLDILLPDVNGWQICEIVRKSDQDEISEIPIIMLTALGSPEEKLQGIELGADDYIPKPFSIKEVLLKIDRLIERETKKKHLHTEFDRLNRLESRRNDFQNMLFHEVKNQLVIIGGYSSRIAENDSPTPEAYRQWGGIIRECSRSLNTLADEILMLSRLEDGNYTLSEQEISLEEMVQESLFDLSEQAEEKGIALHFHPSGNVPPVRLNTTAVKIAISSLIENAIKYSPKDSLVTVRTVFKDGCVVVQVRDRGPGIPETERERIFEKFYRGENVKKQTKGTGLGLYISKKLIESMGGAIRLENPPGMGTCFSVFFSIGTALPEYSE